MIEKVKKTIADGAALWSDVAAPNLVADEMAAGLEAVIEGFEALRGTTEFEDEPSSWRPTENADPSS